MKSDHNNKEFIKQIKENSPIINFIDKQETVKVLFSKELVLDSSSKSIYLSNFIKKSYLNTITERVLYNIENVEDTDLNNIEEIKYIEINKDIFKRLLIIINNNSNDGNDKEVECRNNNYSNYRVKHKNSKQKENRYSSDSNDYINNAKYNNKGIELLSDNKYIIRKLEVS